MLFKVVFCSRDEKKLKKNDVARSGRGLAVLGGLGSQSDPRKTGC